MFCKFCGKQIDNDAVFCSYCGNNLQQGSRDAEIQAALEWKQAQKDYKEQMNQRIAQQQAEAAKQQAMRNASSKDHLKGSGHARGAGASPVPADEMALFRKFNPDATEAEIQAFYNNYKNR